MHTGSNPLSMGEGSEVVIDGQKEKEARKLSTKDYVMVKADNVSRKESFNNARCPSGRPYVSSSDNTPLSPWERPNNDLSAWLVDLVFS